MKAIQAKLHPRHTRDFVLPIIVAALAVIAFFLLNPKIEMESATESGITVFFEKGADWKAEAKKILSEEPVAIKECLLSGPREENSAIGFLAAQIAARMSQKGLKSTVYGEVVDETDFAKRRIGCSPENGECSRIQVELKSGSRNAIVVEKSSILIEGRPKWMIENAEAIAKAIVQ